MLFSKRLQTKHDAQNVKTIRIGAFKYKIRKVNPLLDFTSENMPQIYTAYLSKRPVVSTEANLTIQQLQRFQEEMKSVVVAGLVEPALVPTGKGELRGKEDGITVDDIFRDEETAISLYLEILSHSLNRFKGLRGLFFSIKIKHALLIEWQKSTASFRAKSFSKTASAV